jgi:hypothetical protein
MVAGETFREGRPRRLLTGDYARAPDRAVPSRPAGTLTWTPLAVPVLRKSLRMTSIVKPYFDADADSPLEAFVAEADRHPVFRLLDESTR